MKLMGTKVKCLININGAFDAERKKTERKQLVQSHPILAKLHDVYTQIYEVAYADYCPLCSSW